MSNVSPKTLALLATDLSTLTNVEMARLFNELNEAPELPAAAKSTKDVIRFRTVKDGLASVKKHINLIKKAIKDMDTSKQTVIPGAEKSFTPSVAGATMPTTKAGDPANPEDKAKRDQERADKSAAREAARQAQVKAQIEANQAAKAAKEQKAAAKEAEKAAKAQEKASKEAAKEAEKAAKEAAKANELAVKEQGKAIKAQDRENAKAAKANELAAAKAVKVAEREAKKAADALAKQTRALERGNARGAFPYSRKPMFLMHQEGTPVVPFREGTKYGNMVKLMQRPEGATMDELYAEVASRGASWSYTIIRGAIQDNIHSRGYNVQTALENEVYKVRITN
jgi:DNA polymerase III gamma/tau subunit